MTDKTLCVGYTMAPKGRYIVEDGQVGVLSAQRIFGTPEAALKFFKTRHGELFEHQEIVKVTVERL